MTIKSLACKKEGIQLTSFKLKRKNLRLYILKYKEKVMYNRKIEV